MMFHCLCSWICSTLRFSFDEAAFSWMLYPRTMYIKNVLSCQQMCILAPAIYSWIDDNFYRIVSGGEEGQFPGLQSCWGQPSSSDNSTTCLFFFFIIMRSLCIIDVKPKVWPEAALSWIELLRRKIKSDFFIIADLPAYPASISQFSTSLPVIAQAIVKSHNISTYQATLGTPWRQRRIGDDIML